MFKNVHVYDTEDKAVPLEGETMNLSGKNIL